MLNYYFVRAWGERAHAHFRQRHLEMRRQMAAQAITAPMAGMSQLSS